MIKKMKELSEMINETEFADSIQQVNAALSTPRLRDLFVGNDGVAIVRNVLKKCSSSSPPANIVAVLSLIQICALNGNLIVIVMVIVIDMLSKIHSSIFPWFFYVC